MPSTLSTFRGKVQPRLQDAAGKLGLQDIDAAIAGALTEYQQARPRRLAELVTGTGAFDYALDGATPKLSAWSDGFSAIEQLIYPWSATAVTPPVLGVADYAVVRTASGLFLRFLTAVPVSPQQFLAIYIAPHSLTEIASTIPPVDEEAFAALATSYACEALAGYYSQITEPTLSADVADRRTIGDQYRSQAKRWREAYRGAMGFDEKAEEAAGGVAAVQSVFGTVQGERYFFHGRR